MTLIAIILTLVVAILHIYFLVLEMFLWTKPYGLKTFNNSPNQADATRVLAANQGLYNGFLAAGLIWSLCQGGQGDAARMFFLVCVIIAGLYGAYSVSRKIFFVQALPAIFALFALIESH